MKKLALILVLFAASLPVLAAENSVWPRATSETRPWTYWWWMGSAVDAANLTRELETLQKAGFGGVHVIPIYGVRGAESRYLEYLSPQWAKMLAHTISEAQRLGMQVDMTTGTGWCFGGPNITPELANAVVVPKPAGGPPPRFEITLRPTEQVERAAPGGEGYMLNPFYGKAVTTYLERFTAFFRGYQGPKLRAMYHDSFEYRVNWSPNLPAEFERRRGYRMQDEYPALFGAVDEDHAARVKSDYRETLSDLLLEDFTEVWAKWAHNLGFAVRDQAHGSPGNLLDLYAVADIPETEMFNRDRSTLVSKFASSAAHVAGRRLVASETGTWLKEHFNVKLADLKQLIDQLFLAGVNHIVYHGTCYSPSDAAWPGWLFYASTEMNSRNSFWRDVPALNAYVTRSQSLLQDGASDNDVLVYWPVYDVWHNPQGLAQQLTVHRRAWLESQPVGALTQRLYDHGYSFDFVSDRQLQSAKAARGEVQLPGGRYRALVVPQTNHMPLATLQRILELGRGGASVLFDSSLPADVPGWGNLASRRAAFRNLLDGIEWRGNAPREARFGVGMLRVGDVEQGLASAGVHRETLADRPGLFYVRRKSPSGALYLLVNRGETFIEGWIPLVRKASNFLLMDAMTGEAGRAAMRTGASGGAEVYLQLAPGQTVFVRAAEKNNGAGRWAYRRPASDRVALKGTWEVRFLEGGPVLPAPARLAQLQSWTVFDSKEGPRFAGTARYSLRFDAPEGEWYLDLGTVCESARVRLNGRDLGVLIQAPYVVPATGVRRTANLLEVDVTNLPANRIRDLDRRKVQWRIFRDINFVNLDYKPFDASEWNVLDSGLLGPVSLRKAVRVDPESAAVR